VEKIDAASSCIPGAISIHLLSRLEVTGLENVSSNGGGDPGSQSSTLISGYSS
jgi:hypothetical protein